MTLQKILQKRPLFIAFFITLIALVLRTWNLANLPAGFHYDELFAGYNANSVLETGKTIHGFRYPL